MRFNITDIEFYVRQTGSYSGESIYYNFPESFVFESEKDHFDVNEFREYCDAKRIPVADCAIDEMK